MLVIVSKVNYFYCIFFYFPYYIHRYSSATILILIYHTYLQMRVIRETVSNFTQILQLVDECKESYVILFIKIHFMYLFPFVISLLYFDTKLNFITLFPSS